MEKILAQLRPTTLCLVAHAMAQKNPLRYTMSATVSENFFLFNNLKLFLLKLSTLSTALRFLRLPEGQQVIKIRY